MARKSIWDVVRTTAADVSADTLLIVLGATNELRRILPEDLFGALPLLRDHASSQVTGALTSEGAGDTGIDVLIDDEDNGAGRGARVSVGGNRNNTTPAPGVLRLQDADGTWFTLFVDSNGDLRITSDAQVTSANPMAGDLVGSVSGTQQFDLHDQVDVELSGALADEDRFVVSDESETGDPNRWVPFSRIKSNASLREAFPTTEYAVQTGAQIVTHNLNKTPAWINVWAVSDSDNHNNFPDGARVLFAAAGHYGAEDIFIQFESLTTTQATVRLAVDESNVEIRVAGGRITVAAADLKFRYQFFG